MIDWLKALDFEQASKNVWNDIHGDWYRDPWGWPENLWLAQSAMEILVQRLDDTGAKRALPIGVPKENFVLRPAMLLDPVDRLAYQALVDCLSVVLIGNMRDFAFGWRLPTKEPSKGHYANNAHEWENFRTRLTSLADENPNGLSTDIVSFFHSVPVDRLNEDLRRTCKGNAVSERVISYLLSWGDVPSRGGIPQRCFASSVLAQFFMRPVDNLLALHIGGTANRSGNTAIAACRWMDDIWVFSKHWSGLRSAQLDLQECLWDLGLSLNAGKTHLYEGDELQRVVKEYEHSAADFGLEIGDERPLEELIERILDDPENASRTTIRFVTSRMRTHGLALHMDAFIEKARQMPHGADHLARLFRDFGTWRELEDWYLEYLGNSGRMIEWTAYQFGTMFPDSESVSKTLVRTFAEGLASGRLPLLMVPLVIQRLSRWDADVARGLIEQEARSGRYNHPFAVRAMAFSGLTVGVSTATTRSLLQQFTETIPQLAFLEGRDFKAVPVVSDFGGK